MKPEDSPPARPDSSGVVPQRAVAVDVSAAGAEVGLTVPVACTRRLWDRYVVPPGPLGRLGQNEPGPAGRPALDVAERADPGGKTRPCRRPAAIPGDLPHEAGPRREGRALRCMLYRFGRGALSDDHAAR
jgi:hypothetical protein